MTEKNKCILIETDGYSITTRLFNDCNSAFNAMSNRFDELCPEKLDESSEEMSSVNSLDAILYANGETVYVWKIVELPAPTPEEIFNIYHVRDKEYRKEDARRHLLTEFLGADDIDEVDDEAKEDFKETYGVDFDEIWNNEEMFDDMAEEFADKQDCNVAENDTWFLIIHNYLEDLRLSIKDREG